MDKRAGTSHKHTPQELGQVVELWCELLEVRGVGQTVVPRLWDAVEQAVRVVQATTLQGCGVGCEGLQPQQVEHNRTLVRKYPRSCMDTIGMDMMLTRGNHHARRPTPPALSPFTMKDLK